MGQTAPLAESLKIIFYIPLFGSWEWIKFLESPREEWRQEPSQCLMDPLSKGMPFFQLFGLALKALNISLFFVFLPYPAPFLTPSLWKAEVQLFLIARLKLSGLLCFWTWPSDYSLKGLVSTTSFFPLDILSRACSINPVYLKQPCNNSCGVLEKVINRICLRFFSPSLIGKHPICGLKGKSSSAPAQRSKIGENIKADTARWSEWASTGFSATSAFVLSTPTWVGVSFQTRCCKERKQK